MADAPPALMAATGKRRRGVLSPYELMTVVFLIAMAFPFLFRKQSEWQIVYVGAAQQLRSGESLYASGQSYVYPPFMVLVATPFSHLPEKASRAVWFLCNALALIVCIRAAWKLSGGGQRLPNWASARSEHLIVLLALGCGGYYVLGAFAHQQTDLVIAALVIHGCLALNEARAYRAATLFGIAAACKCTPLLFLPYLVWRGRAVAGIWLLAVAICVNLLPDLIARRPNGGLWLVEWWRCYIAPQVRGDRLPGVWASDIIYNQSIAGAFNRWTQTEWVWTTRGVVIDLQAQPLSPEGLKRGVQWTLAVVIVGGLLVMLRRPFRRLPESRVAGNVSRASIESSLIVVLMPLLSPMSSKPHFCTLLLPGFCLARMAVQSIQLNTVARVLLGAAILCGLVTNKDLVRPRLYTLALWYGLVTVSAVILGLLCGWVLLTRRCETTRMASPAIDDSSCTRPRKAA